MPEFINNFDLSYTLGSDYVTIYGSLVQCTPLVVNRQQQAVVSVSKDLLQRAEDVEVTLVVVGSWRLNNVTVPS